MLELRLLEGEAEWAGSPAARVPLEVGRFRCGRRDDNELVLLDQAVSRHHFDIELTEAGEVLLHLAEGAAELLVAGFRVESRHVLVPGDTVSAGGVRLRLVDNRQNRSAGATMAVSARPSTLIRLDRDEQQDALAASGRRTLHLLARFGDTLRNIDDPRKMRESLLALVREHLPVTRVLLALSRDDELVPECWDLEDDDGDEVPRFDMSASLLQHIEDASCVCIVEEASELELGKSAAAASIRSAMGAALREGDQLRGLLYCDNQRRSVRFSEEDRAFFAVLAGLTAASLSTSRRLAAVAAGADAARDDLDSRDRLLGQSPVMCTLAEHARRFARLRSPILILGERGTGKSLTARFIHRHSSRATNPFVHVNCASIPASIAESELFGIGKDAGISGVGREGRPGQIQKAEGGTLFLDEIGDLPAEVQPKLLVALREGIITPVGAADPIAIDVRIIAATNRQLEEGDELFRADLLDRISALRLEMPPLRDRVEDIPPLAHYLLARILAEEDMPDTILLSEEAAEELARRSWPGNVADLENALRHAVAFADDGLIEPEHLPPTRDSGEALPRHSLRTLAEVERDHVRAVLDRLAWNKRQAAEVLEVSRGTLDRKIKDHSLERPEGVPLRGSQRGRGNG